MAGEENVEDDVGEITLGRRASRAMFRKMTGQEGIKDSK